MAGHNKWSKIRHRKAVVDKRRSKAWTMCSRAIITAARLGGPDPEFNFALRQCLEEAKYHNVPRDNIERAIKKGAGGGEMENYEAVRYEGYGPGGVAIVIEALTNNRTRTAGDIRLILSRNEGNLGTTGCVGFMFQTLGRFTVPGKASDEDRVVEIAAGAGAADVHFDDDQDEPTLTILASVPAYNSVKASLEAAGLKITHAAIEQIPSTMAPVNAEQARAVLEVIELLEDNEDVKHVYTNVEIPDDVITSLGD